jgi:hypothetical protein
MAKYLCYFFCFFLRRKIAHKLFLFVSFNSRILKKERIIAAMDEDFCSRLEFHLSRTLHFADDKILKQYWCDGIRVPELYQQSLHRRNTIFTLAWVGSYPSEEIYDMTIVLGPNAAALCHRGKSLTGAFPDEDSIDWITIDVDNRTIELRLD